MMSSVTLSTDDNLPSRRVQYFTGWLVGLLLLLPLARRERPRPGWWGLWGGSVAIVVAVAVVVVE